MWFGQAQTENFAAVEASFDQQVEKAHHCLATHQVWNVPIAALLTLHQQEQ
jgi:hypothetical protein